MAGARPGGNCGLSVQMGLLSPGAPEAREAHLQGSFSGPGTGGTFIFATSQPVGVGCH